MKILIDADGCPVVDITLKISTQRNIETLILCDTAHIFEREGAVTITVDKGADSVDFKLVNLVKPGDIVITQDYGLAAMCLARNAIPLSQDGLVYSDQNIHGLLQFRHASKRIRNAGGRLKGPAKRRPDQDESFKAALIKLLSDQKTALS